MNLNDKVSIEYGGLWRIIKPYGWYSSSAGNLLMMAYTEDNGIRSYRFDRITGTSIDSDDDEVQGIPDDNLVVEDQVEYENEITENMHDYVEKVERETKLQEIQEELQEEQSSIQDNNQQENINEFEQQNIQEQNTEQNVNEFEQKNNQEQNINENEW